jgi:muramoyltetrapeptide carboxypeptidase
MAIIDPDSVDPRGYGYHTIQSTITVGKGGIAGIQGDPETSQSVRPARGGIVVLEEVREDPYRIDRQLTQLLRAGWFDDVRGIVCGAFIDCGDPVEVAAVLLDRLAPLGVPMVMDADIGHTKTSLPVPLGVLATLDATRGSLTLSAPALA